MMSDDHTFGDEVPGSDPLDHLFGTVARCQCRVAGTPNAQAAYAINKGENGGNIAAAAVCRAL